MPEFEFRLLNLQDLPGMLKWGCHYDPRLEHYSFCDFTLSDMESWYHTKQKMLTRKLYGLLADGVAVGFITLKKINFVYRTAEIGIAVNPDECGKGYGTALIRHLLDHVYRTFPIDRIYLDVAEFNHVARRLYEKTGFMYIGEEIKAYENQSDKALLSAFPADFSLVNGQLCTKFLRMSHHRETLTEYAPAKINLGLRIVGKDERGYHRLVTTMASVGLSDLVHIRLSKSDRRIRITSFHEGIPEEKNLAYIAANYFFDYCADVLKVKINKNIEISICKRIPEGAGMGGGSSDAAAVLRGLNKLFGLSISEEELEKIAFRIGSDVPFCVRGGVAVVRGCGEVLEPYEIERRLPLLVCLPVTKLSTGEVYREFDTMNRDEVILKELQISYANNRINSSVSTIKLPVDFVQQHEKDMVSEREAYDEAMRLKKVLRDDVCTICGVCADSDFGTEADAIDDSHFNSDRPHSTPDHSALHREKEEEEDESFDFGAFDELKRAIPPNDLEAAANLILMNKSYRHETEIHAKMRILLELGAVHVAMSGSGPSVYGVFKCRTDALRAQRRLQRSVCTEIETGKRKGETN